MIRPALGALALATLLLNGGAAVATPIEDATKACDVLTASPFDPERRAEPLTLAQMSVAAAVEACTKAIALAPDDGRLHFQLGRAYEADEKYDLAWASYSKGADLGVPVSIRAIARMAYLGLGRKIDIDTALSLYRKAADFGLLTAQWEYAIALLSDAVKIKDYPLAINYLEMAAFGGAPEAMRQLGTLYEKGTGVARDYAKAEEWYLKAANKGHVETMVDLGIFYGYAEGKTPEYDKSKLWFERAMEAGNLDAPHNLALLYENGRGVPKDLLKASELYRKAIERGNSKSMHNLALLLFDAKPPLKDSAESAFWFYQSILHGEKFSFDAITEDPASWDADFNESLQKLLSKDKFYTGPINGELDTATIDGLKKALSGSL
ncbi:MAG: tetratricopeptide repeat protein [Devosia sp.]